ncbi:MAG TPA: hypothetical protein VGG39_12305 [Polyangiaceae bacterium]|jgi:hypothetical protein
MNSTTASNVIALSQHDHDALSAEELPLHPELVPSPDRFDDAQHRNVRDAVVRQHLTRALAHIRRRVGKRRVAEYVLRDLDLDASLVTGSVRTANQNSRTQ